MDELVHLHIHEVREQKLVNRPGRTEILPPMPLTAAHTLVELLLDVDQLPPEPWRTTLPGGHRSLWLEPVTVTEPTTNGDGAGVTA